MIFSGKETKQELFSIGITLVEKFCVINSIRPPSISIEENTKKPYYGIFYPNNTIYINIGRCRPPVKVPGYDWTFPGYAQDLTPYGIIAHEFGHYISDLLGKEFRKNFFNIRKIEHNVTASDNRGLDEKMAEAARLFLTNPDLLKRGRPHRYSILSDYYKPIIKHRWKTVLKHAHPKIHVAAENWINKKI